MFYSNAFLIATDIASHVNFGSADFMRKNSVKVQSHIDEVLRTGIRQIKKVNSMPRNTNIIFCHISGTIKIELPNDMVIKK